MEYQLIRSNRRTTVGLHVKQGRLIIRAPEGLAVSAIDDIVQKKLQWLNSKVAEQQLSCDESLSYFCHQDKILFWGVEKSLKLQFNNYSTIVLADNNIVISLPSRFSDNPQLCQRRVKRDLELWFERLARQYFAKKVPALSEQLKLLPTSYKIKKFKARWGSCNSRGELQFNYLLVMAPDWVIDYVIVHELCHLKYLNHSKDFWLLVHQHYPLYKQAKSWLKLNQSKLHWPQI